MIKHPRHFFKYFEQISFYFFMKQGFFLIIEPSDFHKLTRIEFSRILAEQERLSRQLCQGLIWFENLSPNVLMSSLLTRAH